MPSTRVDIGALRIERSHIKDFGIDTHRRPQGGLVPSMHGWQQGQPRGRSVVEVQREAPRRYLFIVTEQGDRLRFFEHELDIDAALSVLQNG
ncbi:MAG TPA: hypothetical protein H9903_20120 [Candidatus Aquabacterium excrementipullorum]|nr:hypothetical protein [Candidatus Aquabacterium excrementipullorum]